jgi:hypothetical protein
LSSSRARPFGDASRRLAAWTAAARSLSMLSWTANAFASCPDRRLPLVTRNFGELPPDVSAAAWRDSIGSQAAISGCMPPHVVSAFGAFPPDASLHSSDEVLWRQRETPRKGRHWRPDRVAPPHGRRGPFVLLTGWCRRMTLGGRCCTRFCVGRRSRCEREHAIERLRVSAVRRGKRLAKICSAPQTGRHEPNLSPH